MRARAVVAAACVAAAGLGVAATASAAPPQPLDPQNWSFQDNLTWSDYKPIPGPDYNDPSIQPSVKKWRVALILVDYPDRPFTVTQAAGSNIFGNPSALAHSVPRDQVPQFYADFLNKPTALNNFQTMNRYWMENSFGRYGVELVPYGPYRMPAKSYQYHIQNFQNVTADCPNPTRATPNPEPCGLNFFNAARGAWEAAVPAAERATFDNMFWTSAGQDESGAWQEFGEMRFANQDAVTDPFGPKAIDPLHPRGNWASTRYIPWTSWAAAANVWPSAQGTSSTEAESAGMAVYAHELSHNLGIPDNYNNPFTPPYQRTAGGMWDMMSRGSFNGPGGQHTRWQIPPTQGAALGAQHNMRNKRFLNFIDDDDLLRLNRDGLAQTGLAVAEVKAREVDPSGDLAGVRINLDGEGDLNRVCRGEDAGIDLSCEGPWRRPRPTAGQPRDPGKFHDYTIEVVQQIGSDSFVPGHGVLIGKSKTGQRHLRLPTAASSGTSTPTRRTSTRSTSCGRRHASRRPRRATSASSTTAPSTSASTPVASTSTSHGQQAALLHPRQAHRRAGRPALQGRRALDRRRGSADPRRGARPRRHRLGRGLHDLHVPAQEHGRGGGDAGHRAPAGRLGVSGQRHLPPVGLDVRRRVGGAREERVRRREVRRDGPGAGLHRQGRGRGRLGLGHAQREVRERSVEVDVGRPAAPTAPWAATSRRRCR